ncbi:hypothetical protein [Sulfurovum sp.]|uniref:hypothetical protein n=1 Tax=Sulfurovum sp. TaxID=1969726 RepID=UPI002867F01F|nr:hypothetical protein [Sulfurovum sp.]
MFKFEQIQSDNNIKEVIKSAFDADFAISGAWGYTQELPTVIQSTELPLAQFEHIIASMRAYIEMNMTLPKEERFGSINLNEIHREQTTHNNLLYDMVTYEITAMKEDIYTEFINQYKEGYGKEDFDMTEHFNQRKKAMLTRSEVHWFEIHQAL